MKHVGRFTRVAVALAMAGLAIPQRVMAELPIQRSVIDPVGAPVAPAVEVTDVALAEGGVLSGQVVGPQGSPLKGVAVAVRQQDRLIATTQTGQDGRFSIAGLQGGIYQIGTNEGTGIYRIWAPQTAPPAAHNGALVVSGNQVVRGQAPGWRYWLTNPWVIAGVIGAAIAVPIALSNNQKVSTS